MIAITFPLKLLFRLGEFRRRYNAFVASNALDRILFYVFSV
jgi:hypothetical protein